MPRPLAGKRRKLEAALDAAKAKRAEFQEGRQARRRDRALEASALISDLYEYQESIRVSRPDATPEEQRPERERQLTDRFLDAVRENGYVLRAAGKYALEVDVPHSDGEKLAAFDRAVVDAQVKLRDFCEDNADALEAEDNAAEAARIREALDGDDPEAIRDALAGTPA